jgi:gliding motility-associated-like protein
MIEIVDASDGLIFSLDGENFTSDTSFDSLGAGNYTLYYQDVFGCQYESYFSIIEPIEVIASIPEVDIIPLGDEVTLKVNTNAQGNVSYLWTPNDYLNCDTCVSVTLLPLFNGPLSVLVTDEDGCSATASVDLYVLKNRKVYIPNVFSPNDDGFNDRFTIYGSQEVDRIENLEIYDRWGEQIFVRKEFAPNDESVGWDGTFRGKPMNNAAFVYMVKIRFIDGEERVYKGDILLLR